MTQWTFIKRDDDKLVMLGILDRIANFGCIIKGLYRIASFGYTSGVMNGSLFLAEARFFCLHKSYNFANDQLRVKKLDHGM